MSRLQRYWPLVVAAVLLWLLVILPAYYVVHNPLPGPQMAALASLVLDLALLVLTTIVAAGWGSRFLRWLKIAPASGLERWSLAAILGLGAWGTLVFGLGVARGLYRPVGYALLLLLGLGALPEIRDLLRWLSAAPGRLRETKLSWLWPCTGIIGLLSLGFALLPPTAWDALAYHLEGPRLYVAAHRLIGVPQNFYLNFPAQVEMLFTWGLLLKGDTLAQLFHWVFWPLVAALLYGLVRQVVDERAGCWAAALWASVPLATTIAGWAYVDLALAAFVLAAFCAMLRWTESHSLRWLWLSAIFAGLALATKYTAVTWLAALALLIVIYAWRQAPEGDQARRSVGLAWRPTRRVGHIVFLPGQYVALAGLVALPWFIKNWIVTGNPIYPFLFGGAYWNSTRAGWTTLSGYGYSRNPLDYVALPWLMTVLGIDGTGAFDATIGPLLLCLAPLALLVRGRPRAINAALLVVATQWLYFLWSVFRYAFMAQTRLLFPALPLMCLVAAYGLRRLQIWDRPAFRLSWVVSAAAAVVLAANVVTMAYAFLAIRPIDVLAGLESRSDYLSRRLGTYYETMRYVSEQLPADSHLLFFWEPRAYYAQPAAQGDTALDHLPQLRLAHPSAAAALSELRGQGITHVVYYRAGLELLSAPTARAPTLGTLFGRPPAEHSFYPIDPDDREYLAQLLSRCQLVQRLGDSYEVYRLP